MRGFDPRMRAWGSRHDHSDLYYRSFETEILPPVISYLELLVKITLISHFTVVHEVYTLL